MIRSQMILFNTKISKSQFLSIIYLIFSNRIYYREFFSRVIHEFLAKKIWKMGRRRITRR